MKYAFLALACGLLPGAAQAQAIVPDYEFSSVAVDYTATAPNSTTTSLQGSFGQTIVTSASPTNTGQNLGYLGFWQAGVPFAYLAHLVLDSYIGSSNPAVTFGKIGTIPFTAELWNTSDVLGDKPSQTFYSDASGNVKTFSWLNPGFAGAMSIKGPIWLQQKQTLTLPSNPITNYPSANYTLAGGDANGDNSVDVVDFGALVNNYGSTVTDAASGYSPFADFNQDGSVDVVDFGLLVNNYGSIGDM